MISTETLWQKFVRKLKTFDEVKSKQNPTLYFHDAIPFLFVHLACFAVFWTGATTASIILCISFYVLRMWAVTAGYHRYFSHRSFKTSRVFQFILAFLAQTSWQRGVLQWANDHRKHHIYSDTMEDMHSPITQGIFYSHVGWIFASDQYDPEYKMISDFKKYPELVWLDKNKYLPGFLLAILTFLIAGWSGLIVGFFISTVLVYHCTFLINSLTHLIGSQRYLTGDGSRNNFLLAILTMGEGWHNNHHYYPSSTRQGFFWWEIDITYYILKILEKLGIVWDLKSPPQEILIEDTGLPSRAINNMKRFLENIEFGLNSIKNRIESINIHESVDARDKELQFIREVLLIKLQSIKEFPPKIKTAVSFNLEKIISLLSTLIDHKLVSSSDNALNEKAILHEILNLLTFQNLKQQNNHG